MALREIKVDAVDKLLTNAGSGVAIGSGLSAWLADNHAVLSSVGVLVGLVALVYGSYLQRRRDQREQAEHEARMQDITHSE